MNEPLQPSLALAPTLSTTVSVLLAIVTIGGAVVLHLLRRPEQRPALIALIVAQVVATCCAWWFTLVAATHIVASIQGNLIFNPAWSWPVAIWSTFGGLATEAIIWLYIFERRSTSRTVGMSLVAMRLSLLFIVLFWLLQPQWSKVWNTPYTRYVAVLIDDSASMRLIDHEALAQERLDLAQLFGVELANRPPGFRSHVVQLQELHRELSSQLQNIERMGLNVGGANAEQLKARLAKLDESITKSGQTLGGVDEALTELTNRKLPLEPQSAALLIKMQNQIKDLNRGPLAQIHQVATAPDISAGPPVAPLRDNLSTLLTSVNQLTLDLSSLPSQLDEAYWRSLPPATQTEINKKTAITRAAIARRVLDLKGSEGRRLVEQLHDGYALKFYKFAAKPEVLPTKRFLPNEDDGKDDKAAQDNKDGKQDGDKAGGDKDAKSKDKIASKDKAPAKDGEGNESEKEADLEHLDPSQSATDFTAALQKVLDDTGSEQLSGVLILSDGAHNGADTKPVEAALASQKVPVCTVLIGTRQVPKDVAVASLEMPDTVLNGDKLSIKATVKIDGYSGQELIAKLFRTAGANGKPEELDHQNIKVPQDHYNPPPIEFTHLPKENGLFDYQVKLVALSGAPLQERVMVNNSLQRQVSVSDDRIKMLLIDARPRYEFRYLKNLFMGRDKTVHLQYLLTSPDRIEGTPLGPPVHVSASRPYGQFEGNALPKDELEWLKFDVIVLGDVAPTTFDKETLKILDKFVNKRGGTLVVIAGPNYMPHAFTDTPLKDILPVRTPPLEGSLRQAPEGGYRVMLTDEGKSNILTKLTNDPATSSELLWKSLPGPHEYFRWRHPKTKAKDGATVLAFAESAYETGRPPVPPTSAEQRRMQYDNALICYAPSGAGKVLMLTFDQTWRLRYQIGDVYHHRFWGQVLRWATEDKLPFGTNLIKLGTDKPRYSVGQQVTIKSRLMNDKAEPVDKAEDVEAKVYRGDKLIQTAKMEATPDAPGQYQAKLGTISDPGTLRIELAGPTIDRLLAQGETRKAQMEVVVSSTRTTNELVNLTANATVPLQLSKLAGESERPDQVSAEGRVVPPADALTLIKAFGKRSGSFAIPRNLKLWEGWTLLLLFLAIGSAEWILRKRTGLT